MILNSVHELIKNSRERRLKALSLLDKASEYLTPIIQTKFCLWGLDQQDEFYEGQGLWSALLFKELGLTEAQAAKLKERRPFIHTERQNIMLAEKLIDQLKSEVGVSVSSLHKEMDSICSLLTPLQLAKFFIWIEQNQWCMAMLNAISTNP